MNIFYNLNGVGDVLLAQLTSDKVEKVLPEIKGDVTLIRSEETNEIVAFNLFNVSVKESNIVDVLEMVNIGRSIYCE